MRKTLFGEYLPDNVKEAVKYFRDYVHNKLLWKLKHLQTVNKNRHYIMYFYDSKLNIVRKVWLIYQRKPFLKFREYFNVDDYAYTVNCNILDYICNDNYDFIAWVNENGEIYITDPKYMKKLVDMNKWMRKQDSSNEITCHIPIKHLYKLK